MTLRTPVASIASNDNPNTNDNEGVVMTNTTYTGSRDKVKCAVPGCKYEGHILVAHVRDEHGLDPENYGTLHQGAPLFSAQGKVEYEKHVAPVQAKPATRAKKLFSAREAFGLDFGPELDNKGNPVLDAAGKPVPRDRMVQGFAEPTEYTPVYDAGYVFPQEETIMLLMGFTCRDRVLITGDTGTGKTSLVEQVAARLNYSVVKISFDGCITRNDLVGEWIVKGKEMQFQYGVLPLAFRMPGTIIIFDEWDTINEETSFVIQRPLQKEDGKLLIMETGGELIPLHDDNVIVATANTIGQGDDKGLYSQGTRVQNYSQLNRFGLTIKTKYLSPEKESEMLKKKFPELEDSEVKAFILAINKARDGFSNGQVSVPLSPRDLLNWCDKYLKTGDPMKSARYCFLNRMSMEDSQVVEGLIQRCFEES